MPKGAKGSRSGSSAGKGSSSNPFDTRGNKGLHFNVLGRHVKGASRNVAEAREAAYERRERTLKQELLASGKSNNFKDRRFGEGDAGIDEETKMLVRLQKERRRQLRQSSKKSKFNIEEGSSGGGGGDGGAGEDVLTHYGRSLSEVQAFEASRGYGRRAGDDGEDEVDAEVDRGFDAAVTGAHFGGPAPTWRGQKPVPAWQAAAGGAGGGDGAGAGGAGEVKRSYAEIMEEVIAKSKAAKADRAVEKAEMEFALQRLDMAAASTTALLGKLEAERAAAAAEGKGSAASAAAAAPVLAMRSAEPAKPYAPAPPSTRMADAAQAAADAAAAAAAGASSGAAAGVGAKRVVVKPVISSAAAALAAAAAAADAAATAASSASSAAVGAAAGSKPRHRGREKDEYDSLIAALAASSRSAIARDRTKSPAEAAAEEAARLTELEALRLQRMAGEGGGAGGSGSGSGEGSAPVVGWAKGGKLASEIGGDDLGPDESGRRGLTWKQRRRQRSGASILDLAKIKTGAEDEDEDEEEDEEEEEDDGSSSGSGGGSDSNGDDDDDDEADSLADDLSISEGEDGLDGSDSDSDSDSDSGAAAKPADGAGKASAAQRMAEDDAAAPGKRGSTAAKAATTASGSAASAAAGSTAAAPAAAAGVESMPFVLPCPASWRQWDEMVATYCAPIAAAAVAAASAAAAATSFASASAASAPLTGSKRKRAAEADGSDAASSGSAAPAAAAAAADVSSPAKPFGEAEAAVRELLRRIRACHAVTLKASYADALRRLYGILLEDVRRAGDRYDPCTAGAAAAARAPQPLPRWRVDGVSAVLWEMASERAVTGPGSSAAGAAPSAGDAWKGAVRRMARRVTQALADGSAGAPAHFGFAAAAAPASSAAGCSAAAPAVRGSAAWLRLGELLQLRLARRAFPATDFRHAVLTPAALMLGQCLTNAPLSSETDVARGLLHAALALDLSAPGRRFAPDVAGFVQSALCVLAGVSHRACDAGSRAFIAVGGPPKIASGSAAAAAMGSAQSAGAAAAAAPADALGTGVCLPNFYRLASSAAVDGASLPPLLRLALEGLAAHAGASHGSAFAAAALSAASRLPLAVLSDTCTYDAAAAVGGGGKAAAVPTAVPATAGLTRGGLALASLVAAADLLQRLAAVLIPPAFLAGDDEGAADGPGNGGGSGSEGAAAAKRARRHAEVLEAAAAPNGDAAVALASEARAAIGKSGRASAAVSASAALAAVPLLAAPEVLDPAIAALARIVAALPQPKAAAKAKEGSSAAASAVSTGGALDLAQLRRSPAYAWLHGRLSSAFAAAVAARDAVAACRPALRLLESAAPPPALRAFAPLLEDVGGAGERSRARRGEPEDEETAAARAREEVRALQRAKRREQRGAMRELRKDRAFLVREGDKAKATRDGERAGKLKEVMALLHGTAASAKAAKVASRKPGKGGARPPAAAQFTKADRRARKSGGGDD